MLFLFAAGLVVVAVASRQNVFLLLPVFCVALPLSRARGRVRVERARPPLAQAEISDLAGAVLFCEVRNERRRTLICALIEAIGNLGRLDHGRYSTKFKPHLHLANGLLPGGRAQRNMREETLGLALVDGRLL